MACVRPSKSSVAALRRSSTRARRSRTSMTPDAMLRAFSAMRFFWVSACCLSSRSALSAYRRASARILAGLELGLPHQIGCGGSRGGGSVQRARGGQLLLQLVHLLLQIVAFQLPDVGVFLGFPLGGTGRRPSFSTRLQLLVRLAALGLGRVSTLGRGSQLGLQGLHAAVGGAPLAAQLVQLGLQLLQLAVVLQLVLLGLVGQCVHVSQHVIFIKAEQAGTKTLFLMLQSVQTAWLFTSSRKKIIKNACSGC